MAKTFSSAISWYVRRSMSLQLIDMYAALILQVLFVGSSIRIIWTNSWCVVPVVFLGTLTWLPSVHGSPYDINTLSRFQVYGFRLNVGMPCLGLMFSYIQPDSLNLKLIHSFSNHMLLLHLLPNDSLWEWTYICRRRYNPPTQKRFILWYIYYSSVWASFIACAPLCGFEVVWSLHLCPMCTILQSLICYRWQLRCVASMEFAPCTSRQLKVWCAFITSTRYWSTGCQLNSLTQIGKSGIRRTVAAVMERCRRTRNMNGVLFSPFEMWPWSLILIGRSWNITSTVVHLLEKRYSGILGFQGADLRLWVPFGSCMEQM